MNSREQILHDLRKSAPQAVPLPSIPTGIIYPDPVTQFEEMFTSVGGNCLRVPDNTALLDELAKLEVYAKAKIVASLVPGIESRGMDPMAITDPHDLAALDIAILPAEFGVAENGAVWIPGSTLGPERAVFVIAQYVVLILSMSQIVSNMHQAYDRVQIERPGFGLFLCGPSKTADIEQSLVIGAHGARSCNLFLVGS
ncbi:MAG TPA: LUD domain-containing protein [candidate division Zixibacteria bacterium]|nr:LUD domain-containing protein [candidate division Zixibacteria bacterium]